MNKLKTEHKVKQSVLEIIFTWAWRNLLQAYPYQYRPVVILLYDYLQEIQSGMKCDISYETKSVSSIEAFHYGAFQDKPK